MIMPRSTFSSLSRVSCKSVRIFCLFFFSDASSPFYVTFFALTIYGENEFYFSLQRELETPFERSLQRSNFDRFCWRRRLKETFSINYGIGRTSSTTACRRLLLGTMTSSILIVTSVAALSYSLRERRKHVANESST